MENVKSIASDSYQDYLISHLRDPQYAATYLETHLEGDDPDPELLHLALRNISEALTQNQHPLERNQAQQQLNELLTQPGSQAIQSLANWLSNLGLKLTVKVDDEQLS
jgi:DNA-binding phage protein